MQSTYVMLPLKSLTTEYVLNVKSIETKWMLYEIFCRKPTLFSSVVIWISGKYNINIAFSECIQVVTHIFYNMSTWRNCYLFHICVTYSNFIADHGKWSLIWNSLSREDLLLLVFCFHERKAKTFNRNRQYHCINETSSSLS